MEEIQKLQDSIHEWSKEKFGTEHRRVPIVKHLKEEVEELTEVVERGLKGYANNAEYEMIQESVKTQAADCLILIMDLLANYGFTMQEAVSAVQVKMVTNFTREWEGPDENGMYHHKQ